MYECFACNKEYENEEEAKNCCTQMRYYPDGDWDLPRKSTSGTPYMQSHTCSNVKHGGKTWDVWLKVDEKCPMCSYVWQPR